MPTMTLRIDDELHSRLTKLAEVTDRTKAYVATQAIKSYLDLNEWQVSEIQAGVDEADAGQLADHEAIRRKWEAKLADTLDDTSGAKP